MEGLDLETNLDVSFDDEITIKPRRSGRNQKIDADIESDDEEEGEGLVRLSSKRKSAASKGKREETNKCLV